MTSKCATIILNLARKQDRMSVGVSDNLSDACEVLPLEIWLIRCPTSEVEKVYDRKRNALSARFF